MIAIIGGSNIDFIGKSYNYLVMKDSNPGSLRISFGGVARNICEAIARLGSKPTFVTTIGADTLGKDLKKELISLGVKVVCPDTDKSSSSYLAIHDVDGDMKLALCENEIINLLDISYLKSIHEEIKDCDYLVLDTNLDEETIDYLFATYNDKKIIVDGISSAKVTKLQNHLEEIFFLKVNTYEAAVLNLYNKPAHLIVTKGSKSISYYHDHQMEQIDITPAKKVVNATGAGDAMLGAICFSLDKGLDIRKAIDLGIKAANMSLHCEDAISHDIAKILEE